METLLSYSSQCLSGGFSPQALELMNLFFDFFKAECQSFAYHFCAPCLAHFIFFLSEFGKHNSVIFAIWSVIHFNNTTLICLSKYLWEKCHYV